MALTTGRWIGAAAVGCALITVAFLSRDGDSGRWISTISPESAEYQRINRQTVDVTRRWIATTHRDAAAAALPPIDARDARLPRVLIDPRFPDGTRTLVERAIERQWRSLGIDSALVPVAVVVTLDTGVTTAVNPSLGEIVNIYSPASVNAAVGAERCLSIVAIRNPRFATDGARRRLAELLSGRLNGPALLGPCAFEARFGRAGPGIAPWLAARGWDLTVRPASEWRRSAATGEVRLPAPRPTEEMHTSGLHWALSPDALGCMNGDAARCATSLLPPTDVPDPMIGGTLAMRRRALGLRGHWGEMQHEYLSDMVAAIGPNRFERFWVSQLPPDAALRAAAGIPLDSWTQRWAVAGVGPVRLGPALRWVEVLGTLSLAAVMLAVAAWGWGRRQVR